MKTQRMNLSSMESHGLMELSQRQLHQIHGGSGPIREAIEWYYKTMGSFYHGIWDGLTGQEAKA